MTDSAMAFADIGELGAAIRAKRVSAVELAQFFIARLELVGLKLNSVVTILHDRAMAEAHAADADLAAGHDRGPLHGIPYGVKDLLAARSGPTTWGAAPYRSQVIDEDATVVARLHDAGAVLLAKLAMIELAGGMGYNQADASFTGPCKTPWNTEYWSGGSSSGPGACVSAGLVPFAIGSETDGSITNPSSYCGITGLRPTYGLVSRHGAMALSWTMDKLGPMCRNATDAGIVLNAIKGPDQNDPTSLANRMTAMVMPANFPRFATVKGAEDKCQPEVRKNYHAALDVLAAGAHVAEITLPDFPYNDMVGIIIAAEGGAAFRDIIDDGRCKTLSDPDGRRGGYSNLVAPAVDYVDAMRLRAPMRHAFAKIFENVDVLVSPTFSTVAPPIAQSFDKSYPGFTDGPLITACNLVGIPAVAAPSGFGLHGLPTSVMFVGPALSEARLVSVADTLQSKTAWHRRHPPLTA